MEIEIGDSPLKIGGSTWKLGVPPIENWGAHLEIENWGVPPLKIGGPAWKLKIGGPPRTWKLGGPPAHGY